MDYLLGWHMSAINTALFQVLKMILPLNTNEAYRQGAK